MPDSRLSKANYAVLKGVSGAVDRAMSDQYYRITSAELERAMNTAREQGRRESTSK